MKLNQIVILLVSLVVSTDVAVGSGAEECLDNVADEFCGPLAWCYVLKARPFFECECIPDLCDDEYAACYAVAEKPFFECKGCQSGYSKVHGVCTSVRGRLLRSRRKGS
jgi:hypothetical protein